MVRPPRHILTSERVTQLLQAANSYPEHAFVTLMLGTGLRPGEILALRWSDVHFEQSCLQVRRTILSADAEMLVSHPKGGQRTVKLIPVVLEALRRHKQDQQEERFWAGEQYQDYDLVFCTEMGNILPHKSLLDSLQRLLERVELPGISIHDLRLTAAFWMRVMKAL